MYIYIHLTHYISQRTDDIWWGFWFVERIMWKVRTRRIESSPESYQRMDVVMLYTEEAQHFWGGWKKQIAKRIVNQVQVDGTIVILWKGVQCRWKEMNRGLIYLCTWLYVRICKIRLQLSHIHLFVHHNVGSWLVKVCGGGHAPLQTIWGDCLMKGGPKQFSEVYTTKDK